MRGPRCCPALAHGPEVAELESAARVQNPHTTKTGSVVGVERVPALVEFAAANVAEAGMPWARVVRADPAVLGGPDSGPYDRILVSADTPLGPVP